MKSLTKLFLSSLFLSLGACQQATPEDCADGIDNDENGLIDCADAACEAESTCQEGSNCQDGIDNNLDGLTDCEDSFCASNQPCNDLIFNQCAGRPFLQPADGQALGNNSAGESLMAGSCTGAGAPELTFQTGSATNTTVTVTLIPDPDDAADLGLYLRDFCGQEDSEIGCADNVGPGGVEVLRNIPIGAGTSITVVVDGGAADEVGAFTLSISEP